MILELADIRIQPGQQAEFDAAIARGVAQTIAKAKGYLGHQIQKGLKHRNVICCWCNGLHWKITPWISANRRHLPSGAASSDRSSPVHHRWSTLPC